MFLRIAALATALLSAAPALAQSSMFDDYKTALQMYRGGSIGIENYAGELPGVLMDGIDGTWFSIGLLFPNSDSPDLFKQTCETLPITIAKRDAFSFNLTQTSKGDAFTATYTARGGNVFGVFADAVPLLKRYGIDGPDTKPDIQMRVLGVANGLATVTRLGTDILVIQVNYGLPEIYARCPS
jgi:hypothetical protein